VMTPEEAAGAAREMKAKVVIPMHIEAGIGTLADAEKFKKLVGGVRTVEILRKE